jgi:tetratricopeptide (TPR) repeat protein
LKDGNIAEAGACLEKAFGWKPKDVNPDYLPLWAAAESWRGAFLKAAAEYQAHVKKARWLATLRRNSEAIREYEAAFTIIEAPSIPPEIKRLREQSLGL